MAERLSEVCVLGFHLKDGLFVYRAVRSATVVTDTCCSAFVALLEVFGRWLGCPSSRKAWFSSVSNSRL